MTAPLRGMRRLGRAIADAQPFEMSVLAIALFRGVAYVAGFLPASVAEQAMPKWLVNTALIEIMVGAAVALAGVLSRSLLFERAGLTLLCPSAVLYGSILLYERPRGDALNFVVYAALGGASALRLWQMRRIEASLRNVIGGGK